MAPTSAWSFVGPQPVSNAKCCGNNPTGNLAGTVSGRATSLAVDPTSNGKTVFAGTAGGGVWKTTDSGTTWTPLTDNQPSLAIGALAIDPTGQVIYAGTGEGNGSDSQFGQGILKSSNGGTTWASLAAPNYPAGMGGIYISKLAIDRTTSGSTQRVLAATNVGLIISSDAGSTWTKNTNILSATLAGSGGTCATSIVACTGGIAEIVQDPTTGFFWAALSDQCQSEAGNIAVSIDGGNTWVDKYDFPTVGTQQRIGLDVVSNVAYVAGANCAATPGAPAGNLSVIAKTIDGGTTWTEVPSTATGLFNYFNGQGVSTTNGQGGYDNFVAVDPTVTSHVLFGGISIMATNDGGTSFADVGKVYRGGVVHPDSHAGAYFSPSGCSGSGCSDHLYEGNDGGVWSTADLGGIGSGDPGSSNHWSNLNSKLATIQYYAGSAIDTSKLLGGAQDNGSPGHLPGAPASPNFPAYHGGDGGYTAIDPGSTTIFAEYPFLGMEKGRSTLNPADPFSPYDSFTTAAPCDGLTTTAACSDPVGFIAPFLMDPTNAQRLIAGTNKVYLTTNGGGTSGGPSNWTVISPDLTKGGSDNISALALVAGTNTMFAGSTLGAVNMTTNASTWTDITGNLPQPVFNPFPIPWITGIAANPANTSEVWVTVGTLFAPVPARVLHTTNAGAVGGTTWTDISGSGSTAVPSGPAMSVVLDPRDHNTVYVGTYFGAQKCTSCGGATPSPSWSDIGTGLPHVQVAQLSLTQDGSTLMAWTHGRGVWGIDLSAVPTVFTAVSTQQYTLSNSNGSSWADLDATNLKLTITPTFNAQAILSGNSDLWTANAGYNQDLGIDVNGTIQAWKESGGFAGTFSPNAAFVQTVMPMTASTTYVIKLRWKTNKPAAGATIHAGAGPSAPFSPTRLTVQLVASGVSTAVSTQQYTLANSDGSSWVDLDATNLKLTITPTVSTIAILSGNSDLWTANAGYNQDLGIDVNGTIQAWKESGGFAGTFSPNAAFVQTVMPMTASTSYTIKLRWKTNRAAPGATIHAGAGPSAPFSPTSLTVQLVASGVSSAVSTQQYSLANSDGSTWADLDATNLKLTITPTVNVIAILGGNADLWTANAGFNQDLAIDVNGTIQAWKESGGFAGTFSPNAAFVQTVLPMTASTTYVIKLRWKTNKPAAGATIHAAAGPSAPFSPTVLSALIIPS